MNHRIRARLGLCLLLAGASCAAPVEDAEVASNTSALTIADIVLTGPAAHELTIDTSDGLTRAYYLYLPDDYVHGSGTLHPLVMMFHGLGGNAYDFGNGLGVEGLQTLADDQDKILVFLEANPGTSARAPGGWDTLNLVRNDVLFTEELLDLLVLALDVDEDHVYAAGHSLGGRFVHQLGVEIPDRLRAIADVAGFYDADFFGAPVGSPAPGTLLPVLIVHGESDTVVPIDWSPGFAGLKFAPPTDTYDTWYAHDGCVRPTQTIFGIAYTVIRTKCDPSRTEPMIELILIGGAGHAWPEDAPYDASTQMLTFFDSQ